MSSDRFSTTCQCSTLADAYATAYAFADFFDDAPGPIPPLEEFSFEFPHEFMSSDQSVLLVIFVILSLLALLAIIIWICMNYRRRLKYTDAAALEAEMKVLMEKRAREYIPPPSAVKKKSSSEEENRGLQKPGVTRRRSSSRQVPYVNSVFLLHQLIVFCGIILLGALQGHINPEVMAVGDVVQEVLVLTDPEAISPGIYPKNSKIDM